MQRARSADRRARRTCDRPPGAACKRLVARKASMAAPVQRLIWAVHHANRLLPAEEFEYGLAARLGLLKPHPVVRVADDDSPPPFLREQALQLFVDPLVGSRALLLSVSS